MSVESLPYTLLLLLGQFAAGVAAMVLYCQIRGRYEPGFIRVCTWMTISGTVMLTLLLLALNPSTNAAGYKLDPDYLDPLRGAAMAMALFSFANAYFIRRDDEAFLAHATGATTVGLGVIVLVLLSLLVRLPAWSIAGPLLIMFSGAITIGTFAVAMIWGHWYLVKPKLEEGPLSELILIAIVAMGVELAVVAVNAAIPVGTPFESDALLAVGLAANPGFWMRIGIGIIFPAALAYMAYRSSVERSMMSATGLLYIAVGALLAGEALGRGLLFVTGAPV